MELPSTVITTPVGGRVRPRRQIGGLLGYAGIWAFMAIFLIYPLIRLFYDAFTTNEEAFTLMNFYDFFTDSYYLQALVNSLLLGIGTVITTSVIGIGAPERNSSRVAL